MAGFVVSSRSGESYAQPGSGSLRSLAVLQEETYPSYLIRVGIHPGRTIRLVMEPDVVVW